MERTGYSNGVDGAVREHLGLAAAAPAGGGHAAAAAAGAAPPARRLVPEWVLSPLGAWRRRARALARPT